MRDILANEDIQVVHCSKEEFKGIYESKGQDL